jgi:transcriptional regulator with XRE-family HTH domain
MITPAQIRAARAMAGLSQADLAERSGMSKTGLANIESGRTDPKVSTITAIERALVDAGIEFSNDGAVKQRVGAGSSKGEGG